MRALTILAAVSLTLGACRDKIADLPDGSGVDTDDPVDTTPPDPTDTDADTDPIDTDPLADDTDTTPVDDTDGDTDPLADDTDTTPIDDTDVLPTDTVDSAPLGDDTDTLVVPVDTVDTTDSAGPADDTDTTPVDDTDTTPVDDTDTTPIDDTDTTPVDDTDTTPVDDTDTTPVDDTDTTPVDDTDTTPVDDTDTTPIDDTDTTPIDDTDTTPIDDTDTTPVDDTDTTPVDDTDTTPIDDTDTTPVDDTDTTPVDDTDTTPVDDTDTTPVDDTADTADSDLPPDDTAPCGFDDLPDVWPVPGPSYPGLGTFIDIAAEVDCPGGAEVPTYELIDMDGDARPDLVVTDDCDSPGDVGERYWLVYLNVGDGFDPVPLEWDVPGQAWPGSETFDTPTADQTCTGGTSQPAYGVQDLDGDGLPDLVVTDPCSQPQVGEDYWNVYFNNGVGFDAGPSQWDLPGAAWPGDETFDTLSAELACQSGDVVPAYELADLDDDGLVDLVLTDECGLTSLGESEWRVYFNLGGGFDTALTAWAAPGALYDGDESFDLVTSPLVCDGGNTRPAHDLLDLDGDGLRDLVTTDLCEAGGTGLIGEIAWDVHFNTGVGFDPAVTLWSLPGAAYVGNESFDTLGEAQDCQGGNLQPTYGLADLDADGRLDFVIVDTCDVGGTGVVGELHWLYHRNTGAGFAAGDRRFLLPGLQFAGPESIDNFANPLECTPGVGKPRMELRDLTGDGVLELILLDVCTDSVVGEQHWNVGVSSCVP